MADVKLNKTYTYSGNGTGKLDVKVTTISTNIENNTSTENVWVRFRNEGSSYDYTSKTATLYFNGVKRTKKFSYDSGTTIVIFNFNQTVQHENDGTKQVNLKINDNRDNLPYIGSVAVNENITLDIIPRQRKDYCSKWNGNRANSKLNIQ